MAACERRRLRVGGRPHGVSDAVLGDEVVERGARRDRGDSRGGRGGVAKRQQHGARLGAQFRDVPGAVVFLVLARALVLDDHVAAVLVHRECPGQARLLVVAHAQAIDVQPRRAVLHEDAGPERLERLPGTRVDLIGVGRRGRRQVDLGPRDVEEAVRPPLSQRPGFFGVDDVVGNRGDVGGEFGTGTDCAERANECHPPNLTVREESGAGA